MCTSGYPGGHRHCESGSGGGQQLRQLPAEIPCGTVCALCTRSGARCGAGGGDARGGGGAQRGRGGKGGEGGVGGGGGEARRVKGRVDEHVGGCCRWHAPRRTAVAAAAPTTVGGTATRLAHRRRCHWQSTRGARDAAWRRHCWRCWCRWHGALGRHAARCATRAGWRGRAGATRSRGAARCSARALPTARWRRGGVRSVRSQGDCRCKVAGGGGGGGGGDGSLGGARVGERFGLVRSICAFVARFESINTFQIVLTASPEWV